MKKSRLLGAVCACLYIMSFSAEAVPVNYTLNDVVFNDGGTATGTFTFDADTITYSNISIVTMAGSQFSGGTYTFLFDDFNVPQQVPSNQFIVHAKVSADPVEFGDNLINLAFTSPLTNDGGTHVLRTDNPFLNAETIWVQVPSSTSGGGASILRSISGGTVFGTPVPIPAAFWLFGSGLFGIIGVARRKKV